MTATKPSYNSQRQEQQYVHSNDISTDGLVLTFTINEHRFQRHCFRTDVSVNKVE